MSDILGRICADKREHVAGRKAAVPIGDLEAEAGAAPPPRGFAEAIRSSLQNGYALIAEIKKASPSKGLIRADFDPPTLARAYAAGGATCLSVLTDQTHFRGSDDDLRAARAAVPLPVLRKDFILDPYQIPEARALGADCILLILAALEDSLARELADAAAEWGMDVLIEVHDRSELDRAHALDALLIGINNRNLKTMVTDLTTTEQLAPLVGPDRLTVAESGLGSRADLDRMAQCGVRTFLIGEFLMRQDDVEGATRRLIGPDGAA